MKKSIILLSAAAVMLSAACQKEEINPDGGLVLTAEVEQQVSGAATKTYVDGLLVKWSEGDQINVFTDENEKLTLKVNGGAGTSTAGFSTSETPQGDPAYAVYPASDDNSIEGSVVTFKIPDTQYYVSGSFGEGANVAVAKVEGSSMTFRNTCGVLKLQVKGAMMVQKINLTSDDYLCGTFSVDVENAGSTGAAYVSDGGKTLTLDCSGEEGGGVQLSTAKATEFLFVVPVNSFRNGFTATVTDVAGSSYQALMSTQIDQQINRSKIKVMPEKNVSVLSSSTSVLNKFKEIAYIKTSDFVNKQDVMQCIVTDYVPNQNSDFNISFKFESTSNSFSLFGGEESYNKRSLHFWAQSNVDGLVCDFGFGGQITTTFALSQIRGDKVCNLHMKNGDPISIVIDGSKYSLTGDLSVGDFTSPVPLSLFRTNRNKDMSSQWTSPLTTIYYVKIWEEGVLKSYMVPCKAVEAGSDANGAAYAVGAAGLYDLVSSKFFSNFNSSISTFGDFTPGDEL